MEGKENLSLRSWKDLKRLKDYEKDKNRSGWEIYSYLKDGPFTVA